MARVHSIVILQKAKSLPAKLREQLRLKNYQSKTTFNLKSLTTELEKAQSPIILIDCSGVRHAATQTMKQLVDTPNLCDYPCVLIADSVENFRETTDRYFLLAQLIEAPTESLAVVTALDQVADEYQGYLERLAKTSPQLFQRLQAQQSETPAPAAESAAQSIKSGITIIHPGYADTQNQLGTLFDHLDDLNRSGRILEGNYYSSKIDQEFLVAKDCLPHQVAKIKRINEICQSFKARERQHLLRTAFISSQTFDALELPRRSKERGSLTTFLFASAFAGARANLLRTNYLKYSAARMRSEIGQRIVEAAEQVGAQDEPEVSDIIRKVGQLIMREDSLGSDENSLIAASIMAADLTDRVCFHSGFWDPFAARSLLRAIRAGKLTEIHPQVMACIIKFLSESIAAKRPAALLSHRTKKDATLQELARQTTEYRVAPHETKITLDELEPGMRLSRPLLAYDGKLILSAELTLDQDLIWRLWSLASIRPLNSPLIISRDKETSYPPATAPG